MAAGVAFVERVERVERLDDAPAAHLPLNLGARLPF